MTELLDGDNKSTPAAGRLAACLGLLERPLGLLVEWVLGLLVLIEALLLGVGVFARYVTHQPIIWSDELASTLFLWLAMLGSVVAFRKSSHMRMTALANRLGIRGREFLETFAVVASLGFFCLMIGPSLEFLEEAGFVTTPALQISGMWRAAALPAGICGLAFFSAMRLLMLGNWKRTLLTLVAVGAVSVIFLLLKPVFAVLGSINLVIFFLGMVSVGVFAGVPIAFAFGLSTFSYLALATDTPLPVIVGRFEEGMSHLILLAIPLFILLGALLTITSMAPAMVQFLARLIGKRRGGLSYVLISAMYLVSGISGAKAADMAAIAPALIPEMEKNGEDPGELAALLAATGAQTETVPPSLVLITIGSATGVSIASLFTGGLLPGLFLGLMLCAVVWVRARKKSRTAIAATPRGESAREQISLGRAFVLALPALALLFIIRIAVVEGIATATEVATIGIAYCLLVALVVYRRFDWRRVGPMLVEAGSLSGSILIIIGAATAMAWGLTQSGFAQDLAQSMASMPGGASGFIAISVVAFVILGSVLEGIPAIVLFGPLLFPIARQLGVHEVHYAMVVILSMSLGLFAPPFGVGYYMACAIAGVKPEEGLKAIWGYMTALLIGVLVIAAVPWLSTGFL